MKLPGCSSNQSIKAFFKMKSLTSAQNKILFLIIIISLSVSPAFATSLEDSRNYLLIGMMAVGFILLVLSRESLPKIDNPLLLLIFCSIFIQFGFNNSYFRYTTVFFTCMFITYFMLAVRTFKDSNTDYVKFSRLLRFLIIAYFIVLIIQQCCVLFNLPIFNAVIYSVKEKWKLNSLAPEPSHTSRYVGLLMYSYLIMQDRINGKPQSLKESLKKDTKLWICFLWIMLTTVSGTAILVVFLILTKYLTKKNSIAIFSILAIVMIIGVSSDITSLRRSTTFIDTVLTGNADNMIAADHSASIRVVPMLLCLSRIDVFSISGWIGQGIDSTAQWMSAFFPGVSDDWSGGGMAKYVLEYGLITALIFILFSFRACYDKHHKIPSIGFWIICIGLEGINMQMAWLCILLLYIIKQKFPRSVASHTNPELSQGLYPQLK